MNCVNCNQEINEGEMFCAYCGARQPQRIQCGRCHQLIEEGNQFCPYCGEALMQNAPMYYSVNPSAAFAASMPKKKEKLLIAAVSVLVVALITIVVAVGMLLSNHSSDGNWGNPLAVGGEADETEEMIASEEALTKELDADDMADSADEEIDSVAADESGAGYQKADVADIFAEKLKELVEQYGVFGAEQSGEVVTDENNVWYHPGGILSATIFDFDLDGQDEMLVCVSEEYLDNEGAYRIVMYMWEMADGAAFLADSVAFAHENQYNTVLHASYAQDEIMAANVISVGDNCYIFCEDYEVGGILTDAEVEAYWVVEYSNDRLQHVCSYVANGQLRSEYAGSEFENGVVVNSQLYYSNEDYGDVSGEGLYDDYGEAIMAFFEKYGICVKGDRKTGELESQLTYENNMTLLFELKTCIVDYDWSGKTADFQCELSRGNDLLEAYTDRETQSASDDSWREIYIDYINGLRQSDSGNTFGIERTYALFYADDNDVPELYINGLSSAEGDRLCTIGKDGSVVECFMCRIGGSQYIERTGLICDFNGNMGVLDLNFYILSDGKFVERSDASGCVISELDIDDKETITYYWNGSEVTEDTFYDYWNQIMNLDDCRSTCETAYSAEEILAILKGDEE